VVTLTGTVQNSAQKDLTEVYAKDIDNVKSVTNDLVVKAPAPGDSTIDVAMDDAFHHLAGQVFAAEPSLDKRSLDQGRHRECRGQHQRRCGYGRREGPCHKTRGRYTRS